MATLLLTAVGTALGGPIGGAIGALAGRTIDGTILGGPKHEGPRLKELAVTTSSYGQPIPRLYGRMRVAGTIVWATDLVEHKAKSGGRKGQPSVTSYSYTTSFAVALSSRPIAGVGRIWADGNLLRGAAGDLKTAGTLRLHTGHGDQAPDPLIASDRGADCPAFRDCAYVVLEDLALEDFGNRIPALTFEVLADEQPVALADLVAGAPVLAAAAPLAPLGGFANDGGPLLATLQAIDTLFPLAADIGGPALTIDPVAPHPADPPLLPEPARAWDDQDFGPGGGQQAGREAAEPERLEALRYYDIARDFQPGVQRPSGQARAGRQRTIEFPGALAAEDARTLADAAARRGGWQRDSLRWRIAELDPSLAPGTEVRVPGRPGRWRIEGWEWRERGVELELTRCSPALAPAALATDAGAIPFPADDTPGPTVLRALALPPLSPAGDGAVFAAATGTGSWSGAALYLDSGGALTPLGQTGRERATVGRLATPLAGSPALLFEPSAHIEVVLEGAGGVFQPASIEMLANGANRLAIAGEVLQFARADQIGPASWGLTGLLRGRGGTEPAALAGHPVGSPIVLIDDALVAVSPPSADLNAPLVLAAIGRGDDEPVLASIGSRWIAHSPPCPVHPVMRTGTDGSVTLAWTRRARGAWDWLDGVETPLVEETEQYRVGLGPADAPVAEWLVSEPSMSLAPTALATLAGNHPGAALWVRQIGRYAQSPPLLLGRLP